MSTKILLIGQCTLHWGRMEFGNLGNYYIMEPLVRNLHRVFPDVEIRTTFQMSEEFCQRENIIVLPMEYYYGWTGADLESAQAELNLAREFTRTGEMPYRTPFLEEVMQADLVIDFSGDIWGDNANFLGVDRLMVGLIKDRVAQLLGKPTAMLAGSPGPFNDPSTVLFAKEVFDAFDLVTNREAVSTTLLAADGFDVSRVESLACPAFLFQGSADAGASVLPGRADKPLVGFILCGWNFTEGPFDKWPRPDSDYEQFVTAVEFITEELGLRVCLLSHSNGFPVPPQPFELQHGRDFPIAKQLWEILERRGIAEDVHLLDGVYNAWQTKAIIGQFDMLVSGRVHGAVAGLSQNVPTVIIDYGHEPKAHKLKGFAEVAQVSEFVVDPANCNAIIRGIANCWSKKTEVRKHLQRRIPYVKQLAERNFDLLPALLNMNTR